MNIKTEDKCKQVYENLKFHKASRFIVYGIFNEQIKVEKVGERPSKWQDFLDALPDKDYRFGVFDFEFVNADNMHKSKLVFINWNSDSAPMKVRVLYATAKQNFKKYLDVPSKQFTLGAKNDITIEEIQKELDK